MNDRQEHIMDRLAQLSAPKQSLLCALRLHLTSFEKPVDQPGIEQPGIFAKARQVHISLQQFLGLDVTVVKRINEVEANIPRNQIKTRRPPPLRDFSAHIFFRQKPSPIFKLSS
jgi:hypothetical protein